MKRLFALVLAATLAAPTIAAAGFQGPNSAQGGGFQGPTTGIEADTVAKAQKSWDDARVVLTGNITQRVAGSDDKYIFHGRNDRGDRFRAFRGPNRYTPEQGTSLRQGGQGLHGVP